MIVLVGPYCNDALTLAGLAIAEQARQYDEVRYYYTGQRQQRVDCFWDDQVLPASVKAIRETPCRVSIWLGENLKLFSESCRHGVLTQQIIIVPGDRQDLIAPARLASYDAVLCQSESPFARLWRQVSESKLRILNPGFVASLPPTKAVTLPARTMVTAYFNRYATQTYGLVFLELLADLVAWLPAESEVQVLQYGSWNRQQRNFLRRQAPAGLKVLDQLTTSQRRYQLCRSRLFVDLSLRAVTVYFLQEALACGARVVGWNQSGIPYRLTAGLSCDPEILGDTGSLVPLGTYLPSAVSTEPRLSRYDCKQFLEAAAEVACWPLTKANAVAGLEHNKTLRAEFEDSWKTIFQL